MIMVAAGARRAPILLEDLSGPLELLLLVGYFTILYFVTHHGLSVATLAHTLSVIFLVSTFGHYVEKHWLGLEGIRSLLEPHDITDRLWLSVIILAIALSLIAVQLHKEGIWDNEIARPYRFIFFATSSLMYITIGTRLNVILGGSAINPQDDGYHFRILSSPPIVALVLITGALSVWLYGILCKAEYESRWAFHYHQMATPSPLCTQDNTATTTTTCSSTTPSYQSLSPATSPQTPQYQDPTLYQQQTSELTPQQQEYLYHQQFAYQTQQAAVAAAAQEEQEQQQQLQYHLYQQQQQQQQQHAAVVACYYSPQRGGMEMMTTPRSPRYHQAMAERARVFFPPDESVAHSECSRVTSVFGGHRGPGDVSHLISDDSESEEDEEGESLVGDDEEEDHHHYYQHRRRQHQFSESVSSYGSGVRGEPYYDYRGGGDLAYKNRRRRRRPFSDEESEDEGRGYGGQEEEEEEETCYYAGACELAAMPSPSRRRRGGASGSAREGQGSNQGTTGGDEWVECFDEQSGHPYFMSTTTGETSWTRPSPQEAGQYYHDDYHTKRE